MNKTGESPIPAIHWLADELIEEYSRTGRFDLAHDFLDSLTGFERTALLGILFWHAMRFADWSLGELCLSEGYDVVPSEPGEFGALYDSMSILENRPDVIEWLLQHGADIEHRAHNNWTPLLGAVFGCSEEIVSKLLEYGANVDASTIIDYDFTPLMAAASLGNEPIVRLLLDHKADISRKNSWGEDAVSLAKSNDHYDIADLISAVGQAPPDE